MGLFRVSARLTGPTGRSETVDVLVDTGATVLVVPRALAERLESLLLAADPVGRRLAPVKGVVGVA